MGAQLILYLTATYPHHTLTQLILLSSITNNDLYCFMCFISMVYVHYPHTHYITHLSLSDVPHPQLQLSLFTLQISERLRHYFYEETYSFLCFICVAFACLIHWCFLGMETYSYFFLLMGSLQ